MTTTICEKTASILNTAVTDGVIPGGVTGVLVENSSTKRKEWYCSCGYTDLRQGNKRVTDETVYDLASLTKPLVTVFSLLTLMEQSKLGLDSILGNLLPHVPSDKKNISIQQLMSHSSGLPPHRNYFVKMLAIETEKRKNWLIKQILNEPLHSAPGKAHIYSDLGFLLLGWIIEEQTGMKLDLYFNTIIKELGLQEELFFHDQFPVGKLCGSTEVCGWSHRLLNGTVHDDNCRALGGVCGHAGLFGTARGVIGLCRIFSGVRQKRVVSPLFSTELFAAITERIGNSTWCCGFDMPSKLYSSSGKYFNPTSIGHLGFTGTSFWIDWERGISIVLLTNRVHPDRSNEQIKRLRPKIHNTIMESLLRS